MAGRRVYGGSEVKSVLLQNEGLYVEAFDGFIPSSSSHSAFNGSRSILNFEEACGATTNQPYRRNPQETEDPIDDEFEDYLHQPEKKRRLSADKVRSLEKSFEVENKLEPERKNQLAKDLGLQPRQVAIWFQNRRARWKTKQLERDYDVLKSSYTALKVDYENLLNEKEKLKSEVVHLTDKLLLREKEKNLTEPFELSELDFNPLIEVNASESQAVGVKQEDHSSTNSTVFDSDSPRSNVFDQSDTSRVLEVDEEERGYYPEFLKLEEDSGGFEFPVEDHSPFWFWPC